MKNSQMEQTINFRNRDRYVGEVKDNEPNGQGIDYYANGEKYVGEFKDG